MDERSIREFLMANWRKIIGGIIGLLVALLFITFGFLAGFFILICVSIGIYIGWRIDDQGMDDFFDKFRQR